MPSDLVINVRQIGNYPARTQSDGNELVLVQANGLGGPYQSIAAADFVSTALTNDSLGVGNPIPANADVGNVFLGAGALPQSGAVLWNCYRANGGILRYWRSGMAGMVDWQPSSAGWRFSIAPSGAPGSTVSGLTSLLELSTAGALRLPGGTLTVARDASAPNEVVTRRQMQSSTVANFNGRTGAVRLQESDVYRALGLRSEIATNATIVARLQELLAGHPFVWSFNGRTGNIHLTQDDIERLWFCDNLWPRVPTPPLTDNSLRIANTEWVNNFVYKHLWPVLAGIYAPLNSPNFTGIPTAPQPDLTANDTQIATTEWVKSILTSIGAGVLTWNHRSGYVEFQLSDFNDVSMAGGGAIPLAPTAAPGTNTTQIASTAFVTAAAQNIIDNSVWTFNTRQGDVTLQLADILGADGQARTFVVAGPPAPTADASGQFWFDPTLKTLNVWDGTGWEPAGGVVEISDTQPSSQYPGKLWWDSAIGELFIWYAQGGGQWVVAGGQTAAQGPAGPAGPQGPQGLPGNQGVQGPPGTGLTLLGSVASQAALPPTGNAVGDMWVTADTDELWAWDGSQWVKVGVGGGIAEAPTDGGYYMRRNAVWVAVTPFSDAPNDGEMYAREAPTPGGTVVWETVKDDGVY